MSSDRIERRRAQLLLKIADTVDVFRKLNPDLTFFDIKAVFKELASFHWSLRVDRPDPVCIGPEGYSAITCLPWRECLSGWFCRLCERCIDIFEATADEDDDIDEEYTRRWCANGCNWYPCAVVAGCDGGEGWGAPRFAFIEDMWFCDCGAWHLLSCECMSGFEDNPCTREGGMMDGYVILEQFKVGRMHLAKSRQRREQLEGERPHWKAAVEKYGKNFTKIARRIGCTQLSAERAIWDLGLWPEMCRAQQRKAMP